MPTSPTMWVVPVLLLLTIQIVLYSVEPIDGRCIWPQFDSPADIVIGRNSTSDCWYQNLTNQNNNDNRFRAVLSIAVDEVGRKLWIGDRDRVVRLNLDDPRSPVEIVLGDDGETKRDFISGSASSESSPSTSQSSSRARDQRGTSEQGRRKITRPLAMIVDIRGGLWIADGGNHRVVYYNNSANITESHVPAKLQIGQCGFDEFSVNRGENVPSSNSLRWPSGLAMDRNGNLWVADSNNGRVLRFDGMLDFAYSAEEPDGGNVSASVVLGKTNFTDASTRTPAKTYLTYPFGIALIGDTLFVSEDFRVVRWHNVSTIASGSDAHNVFGQGDVDEATSPPAPSWTTLRFPMSLVASQLDDTLYVVDQGYSRVLVFHNASILPNNATASAVIGQSDADNCISSCTRRNFVAPMAIALADESCQLFVGETANASRALRFIGELVCDSPPRCNNGVPRTCTQCDCSSVTCGSNGRPSATDCSCPSGSGSEISFGALKPQVTFQTVNGTDSVDGASMQISVPDMASSSGNSLNLQSYNWSRAEPVSEVSPGGATVQSWQYDLEQSEFRISFTFLDLPDPVLVQQFDLLPALTSLGSSIKSSISVQLNDTSVLFNSPSDTATFGFSLTYENLGLSNSSTGEQVEASERNETTTLFELNSQRGSAKILLANQALIDGDRVEQVNHTVTVRAMNGDDGVIEISVTFPFFASSLDYDPDVSVLFTSDEDVDDDTDGSDGGAGGAGGAGDPSLLALLALIAIPIAVVIVVAMIVIILLIKKVVQGTFRSSRGSVIFEQNEDPLAENTL